MQLDKTTLGELSQARGGGIRHRADLSAQFLGHRVRSIYKRLERRRSAYCGGRRRGRLATIAVVAEQDFAKEAKQRQRLSKGRGKKGIPKLEQVNGKARDQAAAVVGISHSYVSDAKAIKVNAVG